MGQFPEIPWNGATVFKVMVLWLFTFCVVGSCMTNAIPSFLGVALSDLSAHGQALGYFVADLTNLLLTVFVLTKSLHPHHFWNMGLFKLRVSLPMLRSVAVACLSFPFIDMVAQATQTWFQKAPDTMSVHLEQSMIQGEFGANLMYCFVVSVCTPVWEESIFRGFLLSSLTRYMPVAAAVVLSSFVFTAAHLSVQRAAYLVLLGCVIGAVFARSRNLLAAILVHALWNFYVFIKIAMNPTQVCGIV